MTQHLSGSENVVAGSVDRPHFQGARVRLSSRVAVPGPALHGYVAMPLHPKQSPHDSQRDSLVIATGSLRIAPFRKLPFISHSVWSSTSPR